jgi:hypothetical protein
MAGGWIRLNDEKLRKLYTLSNVIREIKSKLMGWVGHVTCMGEMINAYGIVVGKPEGKRTLRRPGDRWEDSMRWDLE